jgi:hypothetical protein
MTEMKMAVLPKFHHITFIRYFRYITDVMFLMKMLTRP